MKAKILETINRIEAPDAAAMDAALSRQAALAKPPGSLGGLEDISVRMAGITGSLFNEINRSCVAVFCADNGVAEEGVSSAPQSVTMAQTVNFARRLTGVGVLAESFGSDLLIVDMGVKHPIPAELYDKVPLWNTRRIIDRKSRPGTDNIAKGPAMSREEALRCIEVGIEMADAVKNAGYDILGIGEMGIGNTTTSAAVLSAITGEGSDATCGKGGGINDKSFVRKKEIVDEVSADWRAKGGLLAVLGEARDRGESPIDDMVGILARMGGFDICAMAGAFIGAAANKIPVVIDGYISVVAALAAYVMAPKSVGYMFASHKSWEKGYELAVDALGLKPFLELGMRLGEGSGCPIAFQVIKGACDVMRNMATFEEAEINDDYLDEIRKGDCF
ncbi:MAG: nicotinate-nucleotide--dimethylbenzimidazole phosphoribosyltransferase [Firmicutes bacterium]|nr:nicotinate-nucleotide--dimethylbenzimidazole phosphoribosyltransferase [Bacillota bacterium]MBR6800093.1 nicotinate-nucleotide--dimethylbenzimidazole phosphoribosyltransferase [Bacillota bacterium]